MIWFQKYSVLVLNFISFFHKLFVNIFAVNSVCLQNIFLDKFPKGGEYSLMIPSYFSNVNLDWL